MKQIYMLKLTLYECKQDPDPVFKIRIRPKMDRIRNTACTIGTATGT